MDVPPNLAEVKIRAEIEEEVRDDYAHREELDVLSQRDRRLFALIISLSLATLFGLPVVGLAVGLGVRVFVWASGLQ